MPVRGPVGEAIKRVDWTVLAVYLGVALLFLLPLPWQMGTAVIQTRGDASWNLWWMWWARKALQGGGPLFFTHHLMYPTGAPLQLSRPDLVSVAVSLPLQPLLSLVVLYNLLIVVALVFSAYAMFLLAREVTSSRSGALVAGAVFAFMPLTSLSTNRGHLEWTDVGFLPLAVLGLMRLQSGGWPRVAIRALPLALAMCVSWYQGVFLLLFCGFHFCYRAVEEGWWRDPRTFARCLARTLAWAGLGLALVSPMLIPAVREGRANPQAKVRLDWVVLNSAEPLGPFRPNPLNPLFQAPGDAMACSFGYVALGLAAAGALTAGRRSRFWLLALVVFYVLSLGPVVGGGGQEGQGTPMPYMLLYHLPLGSILRVPIRLLYLAGMALAVLAGWGVVWLERRAPGRNHLARVAVGLSLIVLLVEYWPGLRPTTPMSISPFYTALAREPAGAVLELPPTLIGQAMFWQTVHGQPLVGGYFSRHRPEGLRNVEVPVLRQLWIGSESALDELRKGGLIRQPPLIDMGAGVLDAYGIRYVVLHRHALPLNSMDGLERTLTRLLPADGVIWDDGDVRAYRVPRIPDKEGVVAGFGLGWEAPRQLSEDGLWYRVSREKSALVAVLLDAVAREVRFEARAVGFTRREEVDLEVNGERRATLSLSRAPQEVAMILRLEPGYNAIGLRARHRTDRPVVSRERLALRELRFSVTPGTLDPAE